MAFTMGKMTMGQDFLLEILLSPIRYLLTNAPYSLSYGARNIDSSEAAVWGPCYLSHYKLFIYCMGIHFTLNCTQSSMQLECTTGFSNIQSDFPFKVQRLISD
jgi:hypothetical protein